MKKRKTWLTKAGVEVWLGPKFHVPSRSGKWDFKAEAFRVSTGGRMGLLWVKNLREVPR